MNELNIACEALFDFPLDPACEMSIIDGMKMNVGIWKNMPKTIKKVGVQHKEKKEAIANGELPAYIDSKERTVIHRLMFLAASEISHELKTNMEFINFLEKYPTVKNICSHGDELSGMTIKLLSGKPDEVSACTTYVTNAYNKVMKNYANSFTGRHYKVEVDKEFDKAKYILHVRPI